MLLAYLDESYSTKWSEYWLAAVVIPDRQIDPLTRALDDVVRDTSRKYDLGLGRRTELHGYPLFHGQGAWEGLAGMARARIGVYRDSLGAIAAHDARVIVRGVNVPRLEERYHSPWHPHRVVLQFVLEDVDELASSLDQPALVIADEIDGAQEHRRSLWNYQRTPTAGYRSRTLTRIVDTLHFAPSNASRLVQAADLVAYLYGRIQSRVDKDPRAIRANGDLWNLVADCIYNVHCWYP